MTTQRLTRSRFCAATGIANHVADIVRRKCDRSTDLQRGEDRRDILPLVLLFLAGFGVRRESHSAEVENDNRVVLHEARS
jgi:hypothetical protein